MAPPLSININLMPTTFCLQKQVGILTNMGLV